MTAASVSVAAIYYAFTLRISQKNQELTLKALEQSAKAQELTLKSQQQNLETRQAQLLMQICDKVQQQRLPGGRGGDPLELEVRHIRGVPKQVRVKTR